MIFGKIGRDRAFSASGCAYPQGNPNVSLAFEPWCGARKNREGDVVKDLVSRRKTASDVAIDKMAPHAQNAV